MKFDEGIKALLFFLDYNLQFSTVLEPSIEGYSTRVEETFSKKVWILTKNYKGLEDADDEEAEMKQAIIKNKNNTRLVKIIC